MKRDAVGAIIHYALVSIVADQGVMMRFTKLVRIAVGTDLSRPQHERSNVRVPLSRTGCTNYHVLVGK